MRILVIGGTRFMGLEVVRLLSQQGHDVTVFHRGESAHALPDNVRRIIGNRRPLGEHALELQRVEPEVVLDMHPMTEADGRSVMSTFQGIARRVVAMSSQDVYRNFGRIIGVEQGPPDPVPLTEDGPLRQRLYPYRGEQPLPESDPNRWRDEYDKILVERIFLSNPERLPGTVLRLPAVYGPRDGQRRLYTYLKRMDDHRPAIILDENLAQWRWTRGYMENMAHAIALTVTDDRAANRTYNVGEHPSPSTRELVQAIAAVVGYKGQILTLPSDRLPQPLQANLVADPDMVVDTTRIRAELGYAEPVDYYEGIRRTVAWDRANPPAQLPPGAFDYAAEDQLLAALP